MDSRNSPGPGVLDVAEVTQWQDRHVAELLWRIKDLEAKLSASDLHHIRLRAGLREALDRWHQERENEGYDEHPDGIELRKLLGGES